MKEDSSVADFCKLEFLWILQADTLGWNYWTCMAEAQGNDLQRNMIITAMCQASPIPDVISNQQKSTAMWCVAFILEFRSQRTRISRGATDQLRSLGKKFNLSVPQCVK